MTPSGGAATRRWTPAYQPRRLHRPIPAYSGSQPPPRRLLFRTATPVPSSTSKAPSPAAAAARCWPTATITSRSARIRRFTWARCGSGGKAPRTRCSADREQSRSLVQRAHWPNSASVTTSLRVSAVGRPTRRAAAGSVLHKGSTITYTPVRKVSGSRRMRAVLRGWVAPSRYRLWSPSVNFCATCHPGARICDAAPNISRIREMPTPISRPPRLPVLSGR